MKVPIQPRRAPAKRLHHGIAGSPLATIIPFPEPQQPDTAAEPVSAPKKRGRPRRHSDNATKQKAYREQKNSKVAIENALKAYPAPRGPEPSKIISTDKTLMLPVYEKFLIPGAPHGKGLMITGGYGQAKIAQVTAARERDEKGRRVHPKGYGADADSPEEMTPREKNDLLETDWSFAWKIRFPKKDALTDYEKAEILEDLIRENTEGDPETADGFDENSVVHIKPSTLRCLLCDEPILARTSVLSAAEPHFLSRHKRFVQKAWKAHARKPAPRRCLEDHVGTAQRLHDCGATGNYYCKKCKRLIYGKEFRNEQPMYVKQNQINELTQTIDANPIWGGVHAPSTPSQPGTGSPTDTAIESPKEVAHERDAA